MGCHTPAGILGQRSIARSSLWHNLGALSPRLGSQWVPDSSDNMFWCVRLAGAESGAEQGGLNAIVRGGLVGAMTNMRARTRHAAFDETVMAWVALLGQTSGAWRYCTGCVSGFRARSPDSCIRAVATVSVATSSHSSGRRSVVRAPCPAAPGDEMDYDPERVSARRSRRLSLCPDLSRRFATISGPALQMSPHARHEKEGRIALRCASLSGSHRLPPMAGCSDGCWLGSTWLLLFLRSVAGYIGVQGAQPPLPKVE